MQQHDTADREIIIKRIIDAPRERVWEAWTTAEHLAQWWGPDGFTITTTEFDFRVGGIWRFMLHGPDGRDYPNHIVFTELHKPDLMAHDHGGDDGEVHFQATITLEDLGGKTKITMRSVFPTREAKDHVVREYGAIEGGNQTISRLAEHVAKM